MVNFYASSLKSENLHFNGLFFPKHIKFYMKKYGRVMSHDAEERSKEKVILNSQVRINKIVSSLESHSCPSRLAPMIYPFIYL